MLKDSDLNAKGTSSRLKLKRDLVDFLEQGLKDDKINGTRPPSKIPLHMPPIPSNLESSLDATATTTSDTTTTLEPIVIKSPKDSIFERVHNQYPPLVTEPLNCTGIGDQDIRQTYHPMFANATAKSSDMDIVFVGTASCTPGITRGVSCTAVRLNWKRRSFHGVPDHAVATSKDVSSSASFVGGTWLFDCGECTQLQVQKTSSIRPGKITKIFVTHAHGDHSFGLPGLLCLMGQDRDREVAPPIDIYGPEGLRMWLRVAIRYSVSRIVPSYRVHELKDIPMAPEWTYVRRMNRYIYKGQGASKHWGSQGLPGEDPQSWIARASMINLERSSQYGELEGGRDIFPIYDHPRASDDAPVWEVEDEDDVQVFAAPMSHGIPCVGYVIEERQRPGRLRDEIVKPIVERNLDALKSAGFSIPMKAMAVIKNLPEGSAFTFPDGTVLTQTEAVEPPRNGRKIVVCGDTASARAIEGLALDADVVIHEATNSFLTGIDKDTNLRTVTRDAIMHGHSTPYMAGDFAKRVRAKRLVLNHFSARYKGDQSVDSISIMTRLEGQAMKASTLNESNVAAAWDMMVLPVPQK